MAELLMWIVRKFTAPRQARPGCGSVLYFQSMRPSCRYAARAGTSEISVSSPPASSSKIYTGVKYSDLVMREREREGER